MSKNKIIKVALIEHVGFDHSYGSTIVEANKYKDFDSLIKDEKLDRRHTICYDLNVKYFYIEKEVWEKSKERILKENREINNYSLTKDKETYYHIGLNSRRSELVYDWVEDDLVEEDWDEYDWVEKMTKKEKDNLFERVKEVFTEVINDLNKPIDVDHVKNHLKKDVEKIQDELDYKTTKLKELDLDKNKKNIITR